MIYIFETDTMDWEQIKIFLQGFILVLILGMMVICSVCAFEQGNVLTVLSGIVNLFIGAAAFIWVMRNYFDKK